ncbi:MAG: hypothetical protein Q4A11_03775, partial [Brachymonas sp.]|nr:hypothetical protein [Brachymonas sp.]
MGRIVGANLDAPCVMPARTDQSPALQTPNNPKLHSPPRNPTAYISSAQQPCGITLGGLFFLTRGWREPVQIGIDRFSL